MAFVACLRPLRFVVVASSAVLRRSSSYHLPLVTFVAVAETASYSVAAVAAVVAVASSAAWHQINP